MEAKERFRLARLKVAEHAAKKLHEMRERQYDMLPFTGLSSSPNESRAVHFVPEHLQETFEKEDNLAVLACKLLLQTRYAIAGSDRHRSLLSAANRTCTSWLGFL